MPSRMPDDAGGRSDVEPDAGRCLLRTMPELLEMRTMAVTEAKMLPSVLALVEMRTMAVTEAKMPPPVLALLKMRTMAVTKMLLAVVSELHRASAASPSSASSAEPEIRAPAASPSRARLVAVLVLGLLRPPSLVALTDAPPSEQKGSRRTTPIALQLPKPQER